MMLRKETMTPEMGWRSAVAFPRRSALTIVRRASLRIRRPIAGPEVGSLTTSAAAAAALSASSPLAVALAAAGARGRLGRGAERTEGTLLNMGRAL